MLKITQLDTQYEDLPEVEKLILDIVDDLYFTIYNYNGMYPVEKDTLLNSLFRIYDIILTNERLDYIAAIRLLISFVEEANLNLDYDTKEGYGAYMKPEYRRAYLLLHNHRNNASPQPMTTERY